MLRISKLSHGRADYYLLPTGVLGNKQIEPAGQWMESSSFLKLQGAVDRERWYSILAGIDPATGNVLSANQGRVKVPGFDLTFCAPKSVSLLAGIGDQEVSSATIASHDRAVSTALNYLECHGMAVRRTAESHEKLILPVEGMVGANFLHRTARSLDPHLHTHSVVANLGSDPEKSWSALDGRGLYAHRAAADALYHTVLRYELGSRLGVEWEQPVNGRADIKGIPREVILEFSTRTAQIAEYLDSRGIGASSNARYIAGVATRGEKDLDISADDLVGQWRDRAMSLGMGPVQLDNVFGIGYMDKGEHFDAILHSYDKVAATLAEKDGPVCRRDVVRAWSAALVAGAPGEEINRAVDSVIGLASHNLQSEVGRRNGLDRGDGMRRGNDPAIGGVGVREERIEVSAIEVAIRNSRDVARERYEWPAGMQYRGMSVETTGQISGGRALQGLLDRIGPQPEDEHCLAAWSEAYKAIHSYGERWLGVVGAGDSGQEVGNSRVGSDQWQGTGDSLRQNSLRQRVEANDLERLISQTRLQLQLGHEIVDSRMDYGLEL